MGVVPRCCWCWLLVAVAVGILIAVSTISFFSPAASAYDGPVAPSEEALPMRTRPSARTITHDPRDHDTAGLAAEHKASAVDATSQMAHQLVLHEAPSPGSLSALSSPLADSPAAAQKLLRPP